MSRWQSRAFNKLLERVIRQRLAHCADILEMRKLVSSIDRYGSLIDIPRAMRRSPVSFGGVPCEWNTMPGSRDDLLVLYFHGGGFCFVSPNIHHSFLARIGQSVGARGLMVDYRLAPEFPFPDAHQDCFEVYRALLDSGYDSEQIILMGDSAGGNLVFGTLFQAQTKALPMPRGAVVLSPACDMLMTGRSAFVKHRADPFFDLATLLLMRNTHLADAAPQDPLASPIYAEFGPMPPVMFLVGSEEMLLDDSTRMAHKLEQAGNQVKLHVAEGMPHVYPLFHQLKESSEAIAQISEFIAQLSPDRLPVDPSAESETIPQQSNATEPFPDANQDLNTSGS